jgi:hypothetical protein
MVVRQSQVHQAILLEYFSIAWMVAEGGLSFWSGIAAQGLSLEALGLDSLIEVISDRVMLCWLRMEKQNRHRSMVDMRRNGRLMSWQGAYLLTPAPALDAWKEMIKQALHDSLHRRRGGLDGAVC